MAAAKDNRVPAISNLPQHRARFDANEAKPGPRVVQRRLERDPFQITAVEGAPGGVMGARKLDLTFPKDGMTLKAKWKATSESGDGWNNSPRREIAAYWAHKVHRVDASANRAITGDTAEFIGNQMPTFQANLSNTFTLFRNVRVFGLLEAKTGYYVYNVNQENRDRGRVNSFEIVNPADKGGCGCATGPSAGGAAWLAAFVLACARRVRPTARAGVRPRRTGGWPHPR